MTVNPPKKVLSKRAAVTLDPVKVVRCFPNGLKNNTKSGWTDRAWFDLGVVKSKMTRVVSAPKKMST